MLIQQKVVRRIDMNNKNDTLFLPQGSVRAIIALLLILPLPIMTYLSIEISPGYYTLIGMVVTFYFKSKDQNNGKS